MFFVFFSQRCINIIKKKKESWNVDQHIESLFDAYIETCSTYSSCSTVDFEQFVIRSKCVTLNNYI